MDLAALQARGGFVPAAPTPKAIKWEHDDPETGEKVTDEFTIHIARLSYAAMERLALENAADRSRGALMISACVRLGPEGSETIPYDAAARLDPELAALFIRAVNEANDRKNSRPPMKSGTSSSSTASAAAPSRKQKSA